MFGLTPYTRRNNVAYYDPFRELENFEKAFFGSGEMPTFKTDIRDAGKAFELEADLPGFEKKDIHLDINGDVLTVSAERHSAHEEKDEKGKYIRCERSYGAYQRSFDISGIDSENISAKFDNGVLTLTLPSKKPLAPSTRKLTIE